MKIINMQGIQLIMFCTIPILLAMCFTASAGPLGTKTGRSKANTYLINKWKIWFDLNDVNDDGILSLDDTKIFERKFHEGLDDLNNGYLMLDNKTEIAEDDFIEILKVRYESDKAEFTEMIYELELELSRALDLDGDNFVSKDELVDNMVSAGHKNRKEDESFFFAFPDINERVPVEVMATCFVRFLTEDDKTKPDVLKLLFDSV
ncbi:sarcoplasmic calcium-binding protein-like [Ruditapes philippinarum]|uniref:sarcoplasmic calcium-binding protein-like n=1 Tax=Ruditapes philippinarum TaxID=129788 RepID=UPI00295BAC6D|nr:sarcoplasmic calcium-binding protein-like [Ruditapes philippinarum]